MSSSLFVAPPLVQPPQFVKLQAIPPPPVDIPYMKPVGQAPFPVTPMNHDAIKIDLYAATGAPVVSRTSVLVERA